MIKYIKRAINPRNMTFEALKEKIVSDMRKPKTNNFLWDESNRSKTTVQLNIDNLNGKYQKRRRDEMNC